MPRFKTSLAYLLGWLCITKENASTVCFANFLDPVPLVQRILSICGRISSSSGLLKISYSQSLKF